MAVSVVNPVRIKAFAQSELSRTKTDKKDAAVIARFCLALRPSLWKPAAWELQQLKGFTRRLEALTAMYQQERNRLEGAEGLVEDDIRTPMAALRHRSHALKQVIAKHMEQHPRLCRQKALLLSIPGISEKTIAQLLATCGPIPTVFEREKIRSLLWPLSTPTSIGGAR